MSQKDAKRSNNKVANSLVSASCAAVLAVYAAGYARTQSAANRFSARVADRRVAAARPRANTPSSTASQPVPQPSAAMAAPKKTEDAAPEPSLIASAKPLPPTAKVTEAAVQAAPADLPPAPPVAAAIPSAAPAFTPPADPPPPAAEPKTEKAPAAPPTPVWKDGTYTGWGYSRHGDIEAQVVIAGGRIASAVISQCRTRYSCDVIDKLPPQVAQRQSPDVDSVSGATQSADAFYGAVAEALDKAK